MVLLILSLVAWASGFRTALPSSSIAVRAVSLNQRAFGEPNSDNFRSPEDQERFKRHIKSEVIELDEDMTAPAKGRVMQLGDKNDTAPLTMEDNDSETSENDSEDVGVSVLEIASGKLSFDGPGRDKLFTRGFYSIPSSWLY
jgi:hypothetical protein